MNKPPRRKVISETPSHIHGWYNMRLECGHESSVQKYTDGARARFKTSACYGCLNGRPPLYAPVSA